MSATKNKTQEQEIKVEEKKKTEKDYLAIFDTYYKDFNVEGMHDLFESKTHTGKSQQIGRIKRPIFKIELTGCIECGHPVKVYDSWRGETVCEKCGLVLDSSMPQWVDPEPFKPENLGGKEVKTRKRDNKYLKSAVSRLNRTNSSERNDKKNWRLQQYYEVVDLIGAQLQMTELQKDVVKHVIQKYPLQMMHRRVTHRVIISGLCKYLLCRDGRGKELRFNRAVFVENGLDKNNYEIIQKNIERLKIFTH